MSKGRELRLCELLGDVMLLVTGVEENLIQEVAAIAPVFNAVQVLKGWEESAG